MNQDDVVAAAERAFARFSQTNGQLRPMVLRVSAEALVTLGCQPGDCVGCEVLGDDPGVSVKIYIDPRYEDDEVLISYA